MKLQPFLLLVLFIVSCNTGEDAGVRKGLDISKDHPQYWEYNGAPVLLLGGSDEDNLFQLPGLEQQLDLLASIGGNYVRNTMSSRDSGNVWAFHLDPVTGLYDLGTWNQEYWDRFRELRLPYQVFARNEVCWLRVGLMVR